MIIELRNKQIKVQNMVVPERSNRLFIKYVYEFGTNHLTPHLHIKGRTFKGNKVFVDLKTLTDHDTLDCVVKLLNGSGVVIKEYKGVLPIYNYVVLGDKPIRPDLETYITKLENRIVELESEGEVI